MIGYKAATIEGHVIIPQIDGIDMNEHNLIAFRAIEGPLHEKYGIRNGSILAFATDMEFKAGIPSCFVKNNPDKSFSYELLEEPREGYEHVGRLVYAGISYTG